MSTATADLNTTVKQQEDCELSLASKYLTAMHTTWARRAGGIIRMVITDTNHL